MTASTGVVWWWQIVAATLSSWNFCNAMIKHLLHLNQKIYLDFSVHPSIHLSTRHQNHFDELNPRNAENVGRRRNVKMSVPYIGTHYSLCVSLRYPSRRDIAFMSTRGDIPEDIVTGSFSLKWGRYWTFDSRKSRFASLILWDTHDGFVVEKRLTEAITVTLRLSAYDFRTDTQDWSAILSFPSSTVLGCVISVLWSVFTRQSTVWKAFLADGWHR